MTKISRSGCFDHPHVWRKCKGLTALILFVKCIVDGCGGWIALHQKYWCATHQTYNTDPGQIEKGSTPFWHTCNRTANWAVFTGLIFLACGNALTSLYSTGPSICSRFRYPYWNQNYSVLIEALQQSFVMGKWYAVFESYYVIWMIRIKDNTRAYSNPSWFLSLLRFILLMMLFRLGGLLWVQRNGVSEVWCKRCYELVRVIRTS